MKIAVFITLFTFVASFNVLIAQNAEKKSDSGYQFTMIKQLPATPVKNQTDGNPYNGYFYASEAFVRLKTIDIMINKEAIPQDIRIKLGL